MVWHHPQVLLCLRDDGVLVNLQILKPTCASAASKGAASPDGTPESASIQYSPQKRTTEGLHPPSCVIMMRPPHN